MAFGKKAVERLPPEVKERFEENRIDHLAERTEAKMLKVPPRGTPMGDIHFETAVEKTMTTTIPAACKHCGHTKIEVTLELTGTCTDCWKLYA